MGKWARGQMRIHSLENVEKVLVLLRHTYGVHLENVGAHDIVDGNARLTLGLVWALVLRFQLQAVRTNASQSQADEATNKPTLHGHSTKSAALSQPAPVASLTPVVSPTLTPTPKEAADALLHWCRIQTAAYSQVCLLVISYLNTLELSFIRQFSALEIRCTFGISHPAGLTAGLSTR